MSDWTAIECGSDCIFKVVVGRVWPLFTKGEIAVVDAAPIERDELLMVHTEESSFGSGCGVGEMNERLRRVEDGFALDRVFALMCRNDCGRIGRIREDPPEGHVLCRELVVDALHFRNIAVGDGTVTGHKKKHHEAGVGMGEQLDGVSLQVNCGLSVDGRCEEHEQKQAMAKVLLHQKTL